MIRPGYVRRGASQRTLSYYESDHADGECIAGEGKTRDHSASPYSEVSLIAGYASSYSSLDDRSSTDETNGGVKGADRVSVLKCTETDHGDLETSFQCRRRTSNLSEGASDKRRVAVVEVDLDSADLSTVSDGNERKGRPHILLQPSSSSSSSSSAASSLWHTSHTTHSPSIPESAPFCSPVAGLGAFAVVAAADVSPSAYTCSTTPPSSAPAFTFDGNLRLYQACRPSETVSLGKHRRSQSEAVLNSTTTRPRYLVHQHRQASRDVGIVDASLMLASSSAQTGAADSNQTTHVHISPIFQMRPLDQDTSRSSSMPDKDSRLHISGSPAEGTKDQLSHRYRSRGTRDDTVNSADASAHQGWPSPTRQDINHGVFMKNTSSSTSSPRTAANSLLYCQSGFHASTNPLPPLPCQTIPPLRDSPPPPRPPRLHLPAPGSTVSSNAQPNLLVHQMAQPAAPAITSATTSSTLVQSSSEDSMKGSKSPGSQSVSEMTINSSPPSTSEKLEMEQKVRQTMSDLVNDVTRAIDEADRLKQNANPMPPPKLQASLPDKKENARVMLGRLSLENAPEETKMTRGMDCSPIMERHRRDSASTFRPHSISRSPSSDYSDYDDSYPKPLPDPNAQSFIVFPSEHRDWTSKITQSSSKMMGFAVKRFSAIPRPSSRLSMSKASAHSNISLESKSIECIHSHSVGKIKSSWPDAMNCAEIMTMKTSRERSQAYARKIAGLSNYESGLSEWVVTVKRNLSRPRGSRKQKSVSVTSVEPCSPVERPFVAHQRPSSRASMTSEITFPKRLDAYVATDLSTQPTEDQIIPPGPPPLPFPALAQQPPGLVSHSAVGNPASSMRNVASSGSTVKSGSGFFYALSRKSSMSKKERPPIPAASKLLAKRQQQPAPGLPLPRPVQINVTPALKGGPRAPPGRLQRAQSVIASRAIEDAGSDQAESENDAIRQKLAKRSPSVAPSIAHSMTMHEPERSKNSGMPDFERKISSLSNLLPHADPKILAGYLRRAGGQEMLAIGRYLDDEKNNRLL